MHLPLVPLICWASFDAIVARRMGAASHRSDESLQVHPRWENNRPFDWYALREKSALLAQWPWDWRLLHWRIFFYLISPHTHVWETSLRACMCERLASSEWDKRVRSWVQSQKGTNMEITAQYLDCDEVASVTILKKACTFFVRDCRLTETLGERHSP